MDRSIPLPMAPPTRQVRAGRAIISFARHKPLGMFGALVVVLFVITALFADWVAPHDPLNGDPSMVLSEPGSKYPLGGDAVGRDQLSRIIHGARISLYVGMMTVLIGIGLGTAVGVISGYVGGAADMVIQRVVDAMMSIPSMILLLILLAVLGPGLTNVIIALGISVIPNAARILRGATLGIKENQYIEAARAIGANDTRIIMVYCLPNIAAPILVYSTAVFGSAIIAEAGLSFLGLGIPDPQPSWGRMMSGTNILYFEYAPWLALFPGLALSLVVFGFNVFGDALRDAWDPRLRGT